MRLFELAVILFLAFGLDRIWGDPRYRGHPIRLIGEGISFFTTRLNRIGLNGKCGGLLLVMLTELLFLFAYWAVAWVFQHIHILLALSFELFMAYSCLSIKDLFDHTDRVIQPLTVGNIPQAREALSMIVGRDTRALNETGISRAAIETLAENFVDGFISPVFWYTTGGILGDMTGLPPVSTAVAFMLGFKIISTLDSMVGYKNRAYMTFGRAGAKCDDAMNFLPARLSIGVLFMGAWLCRCHAMQGLRTALRDRLKHDSPNAAHAESFMAGALSVRLGGPTAYLDGVKQKPWLGREYPDPRPSDIQKAGSLVHGSAWVAMGVSLLVLLFMAWSSPMA